jgi:hypothetical protein
MTCKTGAISIVGETIQIGEGGTYVIAEGSSCPPSTTQESYCGPNSIQVDEINGTIQVTPGCDSGCDSACTSLPISGNPCEEVYVTPGPPSGVCTLPIVCQRTDALIQDIERIDGEIGVINAEIDDIQAEIQNILANCCGGGGGSSLEWYNVKDYGAVGDGVADDRPAIQATIDAAYSKNSFVIFFPPGEYRLASFSAATRVLLIAQDFGPARGSVVFYGPGATIIDDAAVTVTNTATILDSERNILMVVSGMFKALLFQGIRFTNESGDANPQRHFGILFQAGNLVTDITVSGCEFVDFNRCVWGVGWNQLRFIDNTIEQSIPKTNIADQAPFVGLWAFVNDAGTNAAQNTIVQGNTYYAFTGSNALGGNVGDGFVYGESRGWNISGNTIVGARAEGVFIRTRAGVETTVYPIVIADNTVNGRPYTNEVGRFIYAIRCDDTHANITGNRITNAYAAGIYVANTLGSQDNLLISDNQVELADYASLINPSIGIYVEKGNGLRIDSNSVHLPASTTGTTDIYGIAVAAATTNCVISNCLVSATTKPTLRTFSAYFSGNSSSSEINGCKAVNTNVGLTTSATETVVLNNFTTESVTTRVAGSVALTQNERAIDGAPTVRGDTGVTLLAGTNSPEQRFESALTANRSVILSNTGAVTGDRFRIVRTGLGAFSLNIFNGSLVLIKAIPASTQGWVEAVYDGGWKLSEYGLLNPTTGSGDVVGPASSVNNGVALFDGLTGKLIKDGGVLGTAAFDDTGDFATAAQGSLADSAVQPNDSVTTLDMSTARILGRTTAGSGDVEELTVGAGLTLAAGSLSATGATPLTANRAIVSDGAGALAAATTTATEIGYVNGVTSAIQTQLNGKEPTITGAATTITGSNLTASRALASDGAGKVAVSAVTATELGHLSGVTSAIQTQLNAKVDDGSVTTSGLTQNTARMLGRSTAGVGAIEEITVGSGLSLAAGTLSATGGGTGDVVGPASSVDNGVALFDGLTGKLIKDGGVLGTAAFTASTAYATAAQGSLADSAVQPNDSVTDLNMATARILGRTTAGTGAVEELTVGAGLTLAAGSLSATGMSPLTANRAVVTDGAGALAAATTTSTEIGYVNGVTSSIQTQLNAKEPTITGAATTIVSSNLTVSRALESDGSGKVAVSATTSTELGYVSGVTSAIQTQLGNKAATGAVGSTGITQNTARILGRTTAGVGAIEEITVGSGLSLSAGTLTATGGGGGPAPIQATETGTQTVSSSTPTSVLSATITPSTSSKRVKITVSGYVATTNTTSGWANIYRNSTPVLQGDTAGSRQRCMAGFFSTNTGIGYPLSLSVIDSPATGSSVTYHLMLNRDAATGSVYLNRTQADTDAATFGRGAASIILEEVD